jgi:hypothetical protein
VAGVAAECSGMARGDVNHGGSLHYQPLRFFDCLCRHLCRTRERRDLGS